MNAFQLDDLVRPNIRHMQPYSTARHEYQHAAEIFLDANENSYGSPLSHHYNRYPDPLQWNLKEKISKIKGLPPQNIFLGNGSDEAIDLLLRIFCVPGKDHIIVQTPTYGMYEVAAATNDIAIKKIPLDANFQPNLPALEHAIDAGTKLIFFCSPNNPTGNCIDPAIIEMVLNNFDGLVVIDEAYINYARQSSLIPWLTEYPNLVILQTLSKAWGLAALRLGMAFASAPIIAYMNKVKYPYNINTASMELASEALDRLPQINEWIQATVLEREKLSARLQSLPFVQKIYPSDANFILVKMQDAASVYACLAKNKIIVRDRSHTPGCENCLRITIGRPEENNRLFETLKTYPA